MLVCDSIRTLAARCQGRRERAVQLEDGFDGQNESEDNGESEKHSESSRLQGKYWSSDTYHTSVCLSLPHSEEDLW